jgi:hypothetical protein
MATRPNGWGGDGGRNCPIPELRRSRPWDSAGEAFPPQGATRCVLAEDLEVSRFGLMDYGVC